MKIKCNCAQCGSTFTRERGAVNRTKARKARLFCSKECSGSARRVDRSDAEKRRAKAEYDRKRLEANREEINAKKRAAFKRDYDPVKAAEYRKSRMHIHVEYCRSEKYKEWKREYDRQYLAKKNYGEFAECFLLAQDIRSACLERQSDYEIRLATGTLGKSQKRRRDYDRAYSNKPEAGPLGDLK